MKRLVPVVLLSLLASPIGCLKWTEDLVVRADLSGQVKMHLEVSSSANRYLKGLPTERSIKATLPKGVEIRGFVYEREIRKLKLPKEKKPRDVPWHVFDFTLTFKNVNLLNAVRVPAGRPLGAPPVRAETNNSMTMEGAGTGDGIHGDVPKTGPFSRLKVSVKDGVLHFRRVIQKKQREKDEEPKVQTMGKRPARLNFGPAALTLTVTAPGKVLKSNAHKTDGRTLTWTFRFQKLLAEQDRDHVVEFRCRIKD